MRRLLLALAAAAPALLVAPAADATPGMVSANGCHSHPRHCHSRGELRRNSRGRYYVPGAFHSHRRKHRRARRHR